LSFYIKIKVVGVEVQVDSKVKAQVEAEILFFALALPPGFPRASFSGHFSIPSTVRRRMRARPRAG